MKARHFLLGATLLSAGLLFNAPLFAAVESDIVGYTTIQMDAGKWYQVGAPFVALDGAETVPLNEVFNQGFQSNDRLMVFDAETSGYQAPLYWVESKNAWCNSPVALIAQPTDLRLSPGQAVYISKQTTSTVTFSGKVEIVEVPFGRDGGETWDQVAPVWPAKCAINDFRWSGLRSGDRLMILDSEQGEYLAPLYWVESKNAWCDSPVAVIARPSTYELSPGQAVYINKVSSGTGSVTPNE